MARARRGSFGGAVEACADPGGAVPGSTQGDTGQGDVTAHAAAAADRARTALPGSTQGETGQGEAAASGAGLVAPAAEGAGSALLGSTQGETGQGAAAASELKKISTCGRLS